MASPTSHRRSCRRALSAAVLIVGLVASGVVLPGDAVAADEADGRIDTMRALVTADADRAERSVDVSNSDVDLDLGLGVLADRRGAEATSSRDSQTITDPAFDSLYGRGDILGAGIELDQGSLIAVVVVAIPTSPFGIDWQFGDTGILWDIDVSGNGVADYIAAFMNVDGVVVAVLTDGAITGVICEGVAVWDLATGGYGVGFDIGCLPNPERVWWRAGMVFEDVIEGLVSVDVAPDVGFAGPVQNSSYVPPAAPAPAPAPPPEPPPEPPSGPGSTDLVTVDPARLFDSRAAGAQLPGGTVQEITVAGRFGVPNDAIGAVLNVTAVDAAGPGYLTVHPCDTTIPDASNVNYTTGQTVPNAVVARLGDNGSVCVYTSASTGLIVDVTGHLPSTTDVAVTAPDRFFDSRAVGGPRPAGSVTEIPIIGRAGVPGSTGAVMMNVTAVDAAGPGYLTVHPCGTTIPDASNVNYTTGQTVPNAVVARVGTSGSVCVYTSEATGLIVDVSGFAPSEAELSAVAPARVFDSRGLGGPRPAGSVTEVAVTGRAGVPIGARTVVLNVTALEAAGPGYLTVHPCGTSIPEASNVNYVADETVPNAVVARVGASGSVCVYTSEATGLIVDVSGYAP